MEIFAWIVGVHVLFDLSYFTPSHLAAEVLGHLGRAHGVQHGHEPQPTAEAARDVPYKEERI